MLSVWDRVVIAVGMYRCRTFPIPRDHHLLLARVVWAEAQP
jgi:hypothetical protein